MKKVVFNEQIFEEFLSRHDPIYEKPAAIWDDGLPLGNSVISAVAWGDDRLNVTLNRLDVWEMRRFHPQKENFKWKNFAALLEKGQDNNFEGIIQTRKDPGPTPQQLSIGRFEVRTKGEKRLDYQMRLHLYDGYASGRMTTEAGGISWKLRVSAEHPLVIFSYECYGQEHADIRFRFASVLDEYAQDYGLKNSRNKGAKLLRGDFKRVPEFSQLLREWGYGDPELYESKGIHVFRQAIPENGNYALAYGELETSKNGKTIVISITKDDVNGKAEEEAVNNVREFLSLESLDRENREHRTYWNGFYPASFLSLSDTRLEGLYWLYIYQLGCWSREDGVVPATCGPWQPDDGTPQGLGNTYIWNTQQQMTYFGCYGGNRLEALKATFNMLIKNRAEMRKMGEDFFEVEGGEFLPHMTDYKLGFNYYSANSFELLCGPWMMQMMWNYYKYSLDEDFLREHLYSMLKAQCRIPVSLLERGEDGKLHLPWTMSAEYPHTVRFVEGHRYERAWGKDSTCDLSYLRWMCSTLLEIIDILGIEDEEKTKWQTVLDDLAPFAFDEYGGLKIRSDLSYETSHRHLTHLFPITQNGQINYDQPEGKKIVDASVHVLKLRGTGEWMGWTFSETAKLALMMNNAPLAYSLIHDYADKYVYACGFDTDGCRNASAFTYHEYGMGLSVESNGMYCDALQCFALRCQNDGIHVLDAVPDGLHDISFYHLRAQGAFLVSGRRINGQNEFVAVESLKGGKFVLVSEEELDVYDDEDRLVSCLHEKGKLSFETEPGREYMILSLGTKPQCVNIIPVRSDSREENCFGCKYDTRY